MNVKYINVGIVKDYLTKKISNKFLNENVDDLGNDINEFIQIISESEILKKEYDLFESILNNKIGSEVIASRFIDSSISTFNNYTLDEIINEHKKIEKFIDENYKSSNNIYEDLINLIFESSKFNEKPNISLLFESYSNVLDFICDEDNKIHIDKKSDDYSNINETILNIALNNFNKKYSGLINESDLSLIRNLVNERYNEKYDIYNDFKNKNLTLLNEMLSHEEDEENKNKIKLAIKNINDTIIDDSNINEQIIKLYDLNYGLLNN